MASARFWISAGMLASGSGAIFRAMESSCFRLKCRTAGGVIWPRSPPLHRAWLAVDEVVHDRDIVARTVVGPQLHRAVFDPYAGDERFLEDDAEEGEAIVCDRHRKAAERIAVAIEIFEGCVLLIDINIDRAEATHRCRPVAPRDDEGQIDGIAADRREKPLSAERPEGRGIAGIDVAEARQEARRIARRRTRLDALPRGLEDRATRP